MPDFLQYLVLSGPSAEKQSDGRAGTSLTGGTSSPSAMRTFLGIMEPSSLPAPAAAAAPVRGRTVAAAPLLGPAGLPVGSPPGGPRTSAGFKPRALTAANRTLIFCHFDVGGPLLLFGDASGESIGSALAAEAERARAAFKRARDLDHGETGEPSGDVGAFVETVERLVLFMVKLFIRLGNVDPSAFGDSRFVSCIDVDGRVPGCDSFPPSGAFGDVSGRDRSQ
mmetsp:Transcript_63564/g.160404  ORF Transcript_63564/g.160404 Transcript_63564/m.160404 type:complete len:224 (+) Transcript_63564:1350-2021(+)|eukprot:CAMPEP_0115221064 /NCGR_PEP_ID=MMETSP0270-20121206/27771_1 /TAXON_ID=71861 /ORGANISM="Scrippsiella trochoidea, Strain CCMP3099" /LENGTH=223 /DNA_ID=CAMNT_0002635141 /DNA_START=1307 /DNA_END=1978 /DNA_ORIENTATION=-